MRLSNMFSTRGMFEPQINHFMPDDVGGGGGDWDPREDDNALAAQFNIALRYQLSSPSATADPYGLSTLASKIVDRAELVGTTTLFMGEDLVPIAKRIMLIPGNSDKRNGDIVAYNLRDLTL